MDTLQIDILNPKAVRLLKDLADLNLISIRPSSENDFTKLVKKIRNRAKDDPPSLDEITDEVKSVRANRYAGSKK